MVDEAHIEALFNQGLELSRQGRGREILALYDQITDATSQMFEAWFNKAIICEQLLDIEGAIRHLRLVDCAYACLIHVGIEAYSAQGQKKSKKVL
jgi:hypothetical protein